MEHSFDAKIDQDTKRTIQKEFPGSFHNHLRIIDKIKKESEIKFIKYADEKKFLFNRLADYLYDRGLAFFEKWLDSDSDIKGINETFNHCMEDNSTIYAREGDSKKNGVYFYLSVNPMRINYHFTLEDFMFYTFFKPCFKYYSIAKRMSITPLQYEMKIEKATKKFLDLFPSTTLVENSKMQQELALKECHSVIKTISFPEDIVGKGTKMVRSLSAKCLPHISKPPHDQ